MLDPEENKLGYFVWRYVLKGQLREISFSLPTYQGYLICMRFKNVKVLCKIRGAGAVLPALS